MRKIDFLKIFIIITTLFMFVKIYEFKTERPYFYSGTIVSNSSEKCIDFNGFIMLNEDSKKILITDIGSLYDSILIDNSLKNINVLEVCGKGFKIHISNLNSI